ncbi:MAG: putative RecB family exonuclease [Actinomycetota bacterium]|jgi:putative RecB family exonuclease|nr:putative RecB family exonuclease [Actinomycetota bacterium]
MATLLKLSPSSATDFKSCPQLFKYRAIDRLPEPVSGAAARGSLVHAVLERLFEEPPHLRTPERAEDLLISLWHEVRTNPEIRPEGMDFPDESPWLAQGRALLRNYFKLEDPSQLEASQLEWWVEYELPDIHLRGIIDRLEEAPDGSWILTDYKTGRIPGESREHAAFFGLRFYALVCWRAFGVIPKEIRLVYLSDPAVLTLNPHEGMLLAFERQMLALGKAIKRASDLDDWRTRPTPYCMSCSFQNLCPAWVQTSEDAHDSKDA